MNARCRDSLSDEAGHVVLDRGSTSATITRAFAAGAPPTVTRPPIDAVRGRLSRCGVCAFATEKVKKRTIERGIGNRANRNILRSLIVAEKRARTTRYISLSALCQSRRRLKFQRPPAFYERHPDAAREGYFICHGRIGRGNDFAGALVVKCNHLTRLYGANKISPFCLYRSHP